MRHKHFKILKYFNIFSIKVVKNTWIIEQGEHKLNNINISFTRCKTKIKNIHANLKSVVFGPKVLIFSSQGDGKISQTLKNILNQISYPIDFQTVVKLLKKMSVKI